MIYLDDGVIAEEEAGHTLRIECHRGDVRWRPASGASTSENVGDHSIRILEVDLRGPPKVDPAHFKVLLENQYVRVLRVSYGPHETSKNHEHLFNRVILNLNDQANGKADDVRTGGPRIHIEQNPSDRPMDAIAVELK